MITSKYIKKIPSTPKSPEMNENHTETTNMSQESEFTEVKRRKRYAKKRLGTGSDSGNGFSGPERKVWLNIYRVNNNVTTEMVEGHIKKQPGFENTKITVTELQTKQGQLKNFCVTAPLTKKNEMYEPSFWPPNVGIRRFKFEIHKRNNENTFLV